MTIMVGFGPGTSCISTMQFLLLLVSYDVQSIVELKGNLPSSGSFLYAINNMYVTNISASFIPLNR